MQDYISSIWLYTCIKERERGTKNLRERERQNEEREVVRETETDRPTGRLRKRETNEEEKRKSEYKRNAWFCY